MAKGRDPKSVQNRHAYSRISYLYQAAALFAAKTNPNDPHATATTNNHPHAASSSSSPRDLGTSRRLLTDLRAVSLKTQIRLTPQLKRTICKFCDTLLVEGETCATTAENPSKGGRKPWAELLVRRCLTCGSAKRYPIGAERQKRRPARDKDEERERGEGGGDVDMGEVEEGEVLGGHESALVS